MSTTLDSTTLAEPSRTTRTLEPTGKGVVRGSGKFVYRTVCTTAYRKVWRVEWDNIEPTELSTIITEWEDAIDGEVLFSPADTASTFTVRSDPSGLQESWCVRSNGTFIYTVTLTLREAL